MFEVNTCLCINCFSGRLASGGEANKITNNINYLKNCSIRINVVKMDDILLAGSRINFVPCLKWVKRAVAKENPEKIELSKDELAQIINDTKNKLQLDEEEEDDEETGESTTQQHQESQETNMETGDEFNLDKYDDDEDAVGTLGLGSIAELPTEAEENISDGEDSEKEDDMIKPDDNLILVGRVDGDAAILEVYVQNENEGSLYVHHDLLLPAFPLCIEWLDYEPGQPKGSYCAIGSMNPVIDVWDLDIVNCLEPAFSLGKKGSRRKGIKAVGHRDAVLDLGWNKNYHHILASGSVDKTIILWDLDQKAPSVTIKSFTDKVQSLEWHPFEAQSLLAGGCDKTVRVFDCRSVEAHLTWLLKGEAEKVIWNYNSPFLFYAGSNKGTLECFDCRKGQLWSIDAHEKEVTGLAPSSRCPGLLCTTSSDGSLKVWDVQSTEQEPRLVQDKNLKMGLVHCLGMSPDSAFTVAAGGDNKSSNFTVLDLLSMDTVKQQFGTRQLVDLHVETEENLPTMSNPRT